MYSANDIIGKTLYAAKDIEVKSGAFDNSEVIQVIQKGTMIGIVYSYLLPTSGRSSLYWMFQPTYGAPFYVEHKKGRFDLEALEDQGVMSLEEIAELNNPKSTIDKILNTVLKLGAMYVVGQAFSNYFKSR